MIIFEPGEWGEITIELYLQLHFYPAIHALDGNFTARTYFHFIILKILENASLPPPHLHFTLTGMGGIHVPPRSKSKPVA